MKIPPQDVKPLVPESGPAHDLHQRGKLDACRPSDVLGDDLLEFFRDHRWAIFVAGGAGIILAVCAFLWVIHHLRAL